MYLFKPEMRKNMRKNHYSYLILSILLLLILVGCAKTPQEVKDEINKKQGFKENSEKINQDLEYDTIENIFKTINEVKATKYDNLMFSHKFDINKPEQIGVMKFHQVNNFMDHYKEVVKHFIGDSFSEEYIKLDLDSLRPGLDYDDKSHKSFFCMAYEGYFCYFNNHQYDMYFPVHTQTDTIEEFSLMQEYEDKSYELSDGPMKISEAVNIAQNYVEEIINRYDTFQWIPNKVIVCKDDKGTYLYDIWFVKAYKNVYFSTTYSQNNDLEIQYMAINANNVMIASKGSPILSKNNSGIIEYEETIQDYDEIITFKCATKLLSKKLSSYRGYEVQYVSLENRLVLKANLKKEDVILDPYNFDADNVYESKPCWTFYLDLTPGGGVYAMVDCITGEIEFVDNNR